MSDTAGTGLTFAGTCCCDGEFVVVVGLGCCCGGGGGGDFGSCAETTETEKAIIANKIVGRIFLTTCCKYRELFLKRKDITY